MNIQAIQHTAIMNLAFCICCTSKVWLSSPLFSFNEMNQSCIRFLINLKCKIVSCPQIQILSVINNSNTTKLCMGARREWVRVSLIRKQHDFMIFPFSQFINRKITREMRTETFHARFFLYTSLAFDCWAHLEAFFKYRVLNENKRVKEYFPNDDTILII